ncbi:MAG: tellurite resistance TerB family protein [Pseudomonadota bacterium]
MADTESHPLSPEDCLVAVMIAISASDEDMRTSELVKIQSLVNNLPVFANYDLDRMGVVSRVVLDLFGEEDGLDALFGLIRDNLPERLFETAYALACDVAAADGSLAETELRMLGEIRFELNIERLHAAAIERGARARYMTL